MCDFIEDVEGGEEEYGDGERGAWGEDEGFGVGEHQAADEAKDAAASANGAAAALAHHEEEVSSKSRDEVDEGCLGEANALLEGGAKGKKAEGVVGEVLPAAVKEE